MASASVTLLASCVLALLTISNGFPSLIQSSTNEQASSQTSSYDQQSLVVQDNPFGPDYIASESASGSSSQQNYEYNSNYLNVQDDVNGLYSTGESIIQQEQQQEYSSFQQQQQETSSILSI